MLTPPTPPPPPFVPSLSFFYVVVVVDIIVGPMHMSRIIPRMMLARKAMATSLLLTLRTMGRRRRRHLNARETR